MNIDSAELKFFKSFHANSRYKAGELCEVDLPSDAGLGMTNSTRGGASIPRGGIRWRHCNSIERQEYEESGGFPLLEL